MKFILAFILMGASVVMAQETSRGFQVVPFENLTILDELPTYCYTMPRPAYIKWVKMQNAGAYREAQRIADAFQARNPYVDSYLQTSDYDSGVNQEQSEAVSNTSADFTGKQDTKYRNRNVQITYRSPQYSGGPVVLINPFAPRPAKTVYNELGEPVVLDPDNTLKGKK